MPPRSSGSAARRRPARGRRARPVAAPESPRDRILRAFAERARQTGIRGVVMAELAADLGMSKKTLYQHFESKEALVHALIEEWTERMRERGRDAVASAIDPHALLRAWAERWTQNLGRFSLAFWRELERDHPRAHALLRATQQEGGERIHAYVAQHLRRGVRADVAAELFAVLVNHFRQPAVCDRLGVTRSEALVAAIDVWALGALRADGEKAPAR